MSEPGGSALPDPLSRYPIRLGDGTEIRNTVFLDQVIDQPNFRVGAYSYASDFDPPENWAGRLAPYLFDGAADWIEIGRFCQIAHGVRLITGGANHAMDGLTTYPFPVFDPQTIVGYQPDKRGIVIGNDVWLGMNAMVLPGARIGSGVIVGAGAVVGGEVADYTIVAGNPARPLRKRFPDAVIGQLLALAWWDWPAETIARAQSALLSGDLTALARLAP